jgi:hypothetical protein
MVFGKINQYRVEADGLSLARRLSGRGQQAPLQHGAFEVIVEQHPGNTVPSGEGAGVSAEETPRCLSDRGQQNLHTGIEEEMLE